MAMPLNESSSTNPLDRGIMPSENAIIVDSNLHLNTYDYSQSIVNVTKEYPFDYATIMFGYIMPFVLVVTLITNTLVVMVLAQKHMRTPTNIVLFTMAIVDLMTLLSPSPWYFYIYTLGYHDKFLYPPTACYAHHFMTDVIPVFFHTSSIWLALLLAGQRYIYVCHPSLANTWCTVPRVKKTIIIILVIAFLHQITRFFDNQFDTVYVQYDHGFKQACMIRFSEWVKAINISVYYTTYFTFRIVFVFIIPCVALITLNCLLFRALRRAENKRSELLKTKFKLVGGNRPSVSAFEGRQSSFTDKTVIKNSNDQSASNGNPIHANSSANSANIWNSKRKISSPLVRLSKNADEIEEKDRKFSIDSFNMRRRCDSNLFAANKETHDNPTGRGRAISSSRNHATNDKINNGSGNPSDATDDGVVQQQHQQQQHPSSRRGDKRCRNSSPRASCRIKDRTTRKSKDSNDESYSAMSTQSKDNIENHMKSKLSIDNQSARDDDYTCPGCTSCERQQNEEAAECRRCLVASANDGATAMAGDHVHQPISQCSSLIGGATNTTTNEEVSSCGNTHNISSSMYVVHDETLDAIETRSIREDNELGTDMDRESVSFYQHTDKQNAKVKRKSVSADGGKQIDSRKSSSIDSRLACGCLANSATGDRSRALYRCTVSGFSHGEDCRECFLANQCRRQTNRLLKKEQSQMSKASQRNCIASCSSSDPCIKCSSSAYDQANCKTTIDQLKQVVSCQKSKAISQSNSDYGERAAKAKRSDAGIYMDGNAAATTTTTTTLYSTQTNSVASLVQNQNLNKRLTAQLKHASSQLQAESHSFGSTAFRGSRATLIGNSSMNPPALVITGSASASLRTMDSNRTTLMLIVVVTVFLMVEVPVAIVHIVHVVVNTYDVFTDIEIGASFNYIKLFTNFFIMISYSVNFTIYCSMSKKFRDTFRDLFLCGARSRRNRADGFLYQHTQHSQYNPNQFQSQEIPGCSQNNNNNNNNTNNLAAPPTTNQNNEQPNSTGNSSHQAAATAMRFASYRRANSQQQECEL